jgi:riboflavin synthase
MFNGIIYSKGRVETVIKSQNSIKIILKTKLKFKKNDLGTSISCNGSCLTLIKVNKDLVTFYLSYETLKKTTFKYIKKGNLVNIEKSLMYGTKVSGHYVQGHIDTTAKVQKIIIQDQTWVVYFIVDKYFSKYLIEKGSIAINGVSLTISRVKNNQFEINIIPHTLKLTNLTKLKKNNLVNIEFDIFSKYLLNLKK